MSDQKNGRSHDGRSQVIYQSLFHPRSIAVIGASNDPLKPGGRVFKMIVDNGYEGRLWPVNPKSDSVMGLNAYPSIVDLPEAPELALVAIPAGFVPQAIEDLANRQTGAVIVLTAGFGEKDAAGREVEQKMRAVADQAGMAMIGPNCSGFLTATYKGKFAGIIPQLPGRAVDFISGSGATVDYVMERASTLGLSFGTVINLGNSVQMGVEDLVELYDRNYGPDNARILMLYMESVKKPGVLLRSARSLIRKGCAIVGIKSGATSAGERAAASHTGAMATSDTAVQALFEKAGIIRVSGRGELINTACALAAVGGPLKGKRACIITDAGGPGVMLSDELSRQGMQLPLLRLQTQAELAKILPPESSLANPIDALPSRTAAQIEAIIQVLLTHEKENIDVITVITGDSGLSDNGEIYQVISDAMQSSPIPIIPVLSSVTSCHSKIATFISQGHIYFPDEVELGRALGNLANLKVPEEDPSTPTGYNRSAVAQALEDQTGVLPPETVRAVLKAAGFRLPEEIVVQQREEVEKACLQAGYPLAMKVIGPLHKTDVGGVRLGITDAREALAAWEGLMQIPDAQGVLIQPMIAGLEVILGASRENGFGHLIMFGLGGIYAEVLQDVQFALAPLSAEESRRMIRGIRSYKVLEGIRGEKGMDLGRLAEDLECLGRLVNDFPQIKEIDINPLKGAGTDLYAVDARMIIAPYK